VVPTRLGLEWVRAAGGLFGLVPPPGTVDGRDAMFSQGGSTSLVLRPQRRLFASQRSTGAGGAAPMRRGLWRWCTT
jgi:hypothetical protein